VIETALFTHLPSRGFVILLLFSSYKLKFKIFFPSVSNNLTYRVSNEEFKEDQNILLFLIKEDYVDFHISRRNCVLKHVTEGNIQGRIEVLER
jgi:hypothetical protein